MDAQKLDQAPIHNLAAERSVGFINYERSIRGAKQLASASSAQVKAKSVDLIEQRSSGSFREYYNVAKVSISEIMCKWNSAQDELKQKGLQDKEIANIAVDRRKNNDLDKHKSMGGPFTSSAQVDEYMKSIDVIEQMKTTRLYVEVRYARDTALSLPERVICSA